MLLTVRLVSDKDIKETFQTNLFSVISLTQALLPLIKKSDAGRIVNVSTILSSLTLHTTEGLTHRTSKRVCL